MPGGAVTSTTLATVGDRRRGRVDVLARRHRAVAARRGHERPRGRDAPVRRHELRPQLRPRARRHDDHQRERARAGPTCSAAPRRASSCAGAPTSRRRAACASARALRRSTQVADDAAVDDRARGDADGPLAGHDVLLRGRHADRDARRRRRRTHFFVTAPPVGVAASRRASGCSATRAPRTRTQQAVRDAFQTFTGSHAARPLADARRQRLRTTAPTRSTRPRCSTCIRPMLRTSVLWPTLGNHDAVSADSLDADAARTTTFHAADGGRGGRRRLGHRGVLLVRLRQHPLHLPRLDESEPRRRAAPMLTWLAAAISRRRRAEWIDRVLAPSALQQGLARLGHRDRAARDARERAADPRGVRRRPGARRPQPLLRALVPDRRPLRPVRDARPGDDRRTAATAAPTGDGAYKKPPAAAAHEGAVYVVAGSSGQVDAGPLNHPGDVRVARAARLDGARRRRPTLDARFVGTGAVTDTFRIVKTGAACGNGVREGAEECDGADLGGGVCSDVGCTSGTPPARRRAPRLRGVHRLLRSATATAPARPARAARRVARIVRRAPAPPAATACARPGTARTACPARPTAAATRAASRRRATAAATAAARTRCRARTRRARRRASSARPCRPPPRAAVTARARARRRPAPARSTAARRRRASLPGTTCRNGRDDDCDGVVDCADASCAEARAARRLRRRAVRVRSRATAARSCRKKVAARRGPSAVTCRHSQRAVDDRDRRAADLDRPSAGADLDVDAPVAADLPALARAIARRRAAGVDEVRRDRRVAAPADGILPDAGGGRERADDDRRPASSERAKSVTPVSPCATESRSTLARSGAARRSAASSAISATSQTGPQSTARGTPATGAPIMSPSAPASATASGRIVGSGTRTMSRSPSTRIGSTPARHS